MNILTLNCWTRSEDIKGIFQVKISETQTVFDLQKAIKDEKCFHDVAADTLPLYKPRNPLSRPYKENLSKFILSEHGERLKMGDDELSMVFPEPPPAHHIHIIVDAPSTIYCWLRGDTFRHRFVVSTQPDEDIEDFIHHLRNARFALRDVANYHINLYRALGDDTKLAESLSCTSDGVLLQGHSLLPDFLDLPVLEPLRVVVEVSHDDEDDEGDEGGGTGDGHAQLRAHGYEVEPDVFVDASGGEWALLCKRPDHVLVVYRPTKPNEDYIAKQVLEESNEVEIFRFLDTIPLKSDHVISLVDSFSGWIILPKMNTIQDYIDYRIIPEVFETKVSQVCLGLIKGVAYLHGHCIAHRDINPSNLVVDRTFTLKIIDFGAAMQVEDEDEEVDDQCGTRGWMAPEVQNKSRHSPIKADRWACGKVIWFLLARFSKDKEDEPLRLIAKDLVAQNPKQRPSLPAWSQYLAWPFPDGGDVGDINAKKASQPQRSLVDSEPDGGNTKPPNAKKRRLDSGLAVVNSENVMT